MPPIKTIDSESAFTLYQKNDAIFIDVREIEEFDDAHIPNAHHIPLRMVRLNTLPFYRTNQKIILYCKVGMRSEMACFQLLSENPNLDIANLSGGIIGWAKAGLPLSTTHHDTIYTLGVLLFPGFELLDAFGPLEMLGNWPARFRIVLLAEQKTAIQSGQHVSVQVDAALHDAPELDFLLVPGGMGTRAEINNSVLIHFIQSHAKKGKKILSVCTGAALLAKSGVLDHHTATTNKLAFDWVSKQSNAVTWLKRARWVIDNTIITSSGVAAGIDMTLDFIAKTCGYGVAKRIAHKTEYCWNEDPENDPFCLM